MLLGKTHPAENVIRLLAFPVSTISTNLALPEAQKIYVGYSRHLFKSNLNELYRSKELIALFRNKIPPRSRTDFPKLAQWLNVQGNEPDFDLLGKFGLLPGGDGLLVYSAPSIRNGVYSIEFFVHGTRHTQGEADGYHLKGDALKWCDEARPGERLFPYLDVKNEFDPNAVVLRPERGTNVIGYVPQFYAHDVRRLLGKPALAKTADFELLRNNADAPMQFRLLCRFTCAAGDDFRSFEDEAHEMLPKLVPTT